MKYEKIKKSNCEYNITHYLTSEKEEQWKFSIKYELEQKYEDIEKRKKLWKNNLKV
jgi:hypothetical protein